MKRTREQGPVYNKRAARPAALCLRLVTTWAAAVAGKYAGLLSCPHMEWTQESFRINSDRDTTDRDVVLAFLGQSYWAKHLPREIVDKSLDHSFYD